MLSYSFGFSSLTNIDRSKRKRLIKTLGRWTYDFKYHLTLPSFQSSRNPSLVLLQFQRLRRRRWCTFLIDPASLRIRPGYIHKMVLFYPNQMTRDTTDYLLLSSFCQFTFHLSDYFLGELFSIDITLILMNLFNIITLNRAINPQLMGYPKQLSIQHRRFRLQHLNRINCS